MDQGIIQNIKQEPEVQFLLVLPFDRRPIEAQKELMLKVKLQKYEFKGKVKPEMFKSCTKCEDCGLFYTQKLKFSHREFCRERKVWYCCDLCPFDSVDKTLLSRHFINNHTETGNFHCEVCDLHFKEKNGLNSHLKSHIPKICQFCGIEVMSKSSLIKHFNDSHSQGPYDCVKCSYSTNNRDSFDKHLKIHKGKVECDDCNYSFSYFYMLKQHQMAKRHGIYKLVENQQEFKCNLCDEVLKTQTNLNNHLSNFHVDKKLLTCEICSKVFKSKKNMRTHKKSHEKVECKVCNKLVSPYSIKYHLSAHENTKKFECDLCSTKFKSKANVRLHLNQSHPNGKFDCIRCHKKFSNIYELFKHHKTHSSMEKRFNCKKCNSKFYTTNHLRKHVRMKHEKWRRNFNLKLY